MWTGQGAGPNQVQLGIMTRPWIGALQNLAQSGASGGANVVEYDLASGPNNLDPATLGLPTTPTGIAVVKLNQPGNATITWSSDFLGAIANIDATGSTFSVFVFAAFGAFWLMLAYPVTGIPQ